MCYPVKQPSAEQPPPSIFLDPDLASLMLVSGFWVGRVEQGNRLVRFMVVGDDLAPDIGLLESARAQIGRFTRLEQQAIGFLGAREPQARLVEDLAFVSIDFLRADRPEDFEVEFLSADFRFWLVEFEAAQPRHAGWFFEFGTFQPWHVSLDSVGSVDQSSLWRFLLRQLLPNPMQSAA
jgi:hypothetical protein